jgi:hypothetical protein
MIQPKAKPRSARRSFCLLAFVPLAAVFHHAVFYHPTCMLNPFGQESLATYRLWLTRDPSLPWAMIGAMAIYWLAASARAQTAVLAFLVGFLPLSIWIWDIPLSHRLVCRSWHDGRLALPAFGTVRTHHLYLLGVVLSFLMFLVLRGNQARQVRTHHIESARTHTEVGSLNVGAV